MAAMICVWTALILGLLYMSFSAWGIVYGQGYGFNTQGKGLSFIGMGIGVFSGTCAHPLWGFYYAKVTRETGKRPPPEEHLRKGMAGAILCPVALFWFAFTTYPNIHWIVSEVASVFFGVVSYLSLLQRWSDVLSASVSQDPKLGVRRRADFSSIRPLC